jgi:hypothetical protein
MGSICVCEEITNICTRPRTVSKKKSEELREHLRACPGCKRLVRAALQRFSILESMFSDPFSDAIADGKKKKTVGRVGPFPDLDQLDKKIRLKERYATIRSRHKSKR